MLVFSAFFSREGRREAELSKARQDYYLELNNVCSKYNVSTEKLDDFLQAYASLKIQTGAAGMSSLEFDALLLSMIRNSGCSGGLGCKIFSSACKSLYLVEDYYERNFLLNFKRPDGYMKNLSEVFSMFFVEIQKLDEKRRQAFVNPLTGSIYRDYFLAMFTGYPEAEQKAIDSLTAGQQNSIFNFLSARDNYSVYQETELNGLTNQRLNNRTWCVLGAVAFGVFAVAAFLLSVILKPETDRSKQEPTSRQIAASKELQSPTTSQSQSSHHAGAQMSPEFPSPPTMPHVDAKKYFFSVGSKDLGPHTLEQMRQFRQAGILTEDTLVCRLGDNDWQPASMFVEIWFQ